MKESCQVCQGSGYIETDKCIFCAGRGYYEVKKEDAHVDPPCGKIVEMDV